MDAETLARACEPFFTTRRARGGTGLGLHIVHNLVVGPLGGRIDLSSAPGRGTRLRVWLPARCPTRSELAAATERAERP
jgi:signal transduction histidine kinase